MRKICSQLGLPRIQVAKSPVENPDRMVGEGFGLMIPRK